MDSTAQNNASIVSALIDDVIIMVFECLDVVDILRIRQVCISVTVAYSGLLPVALTC